ncbi:MAG: FAD-binding oxidoreductase [Chloroflexi bacterium]|nr:FAD-binding oxidoreductase [Chloroflexota bacterium]MCI0834824.1 FAD-binding oxidoreductase [Chloroflexota bacterium]
MVDVSIATNSESGVQLTDQTVQEFKSSLRGALLVPDDAGYDAARSLFNSMIDRRPALIARCEGVGDVIACVNFARDHDLSFSIKAGGHNVAGLALVDNGLMIDLTLMNSVQVDEANRTGRVEGGATWGDFDKETQAFGLATTGGIATTTGIAGLTLGGGIGYLNRKYGLACDNLISADVVTADGELRTASKDSNPDLFWAIRGGGGNFGVVTSFEFQLHPVGPLFGGVLAWPLPLAKDVLRFYRDFSSTAPDELRLDAVIQTTPDGPGLGIVVSWCGTIEEGERVIQPLREFMSPVLDTLDSMPYSVLQGLIESEGVVAGSLNYWKSSFARQISDELIDTLVDRFPSTPSEKTAIVFEQLGGAISRIGDQETAFSHRQAQYAVLILSFWDDPVDNEKNIEWTRSLFSSIEPLMDGGVYSNYMMEDEGESRLRQAYGVNYDRLVEIKRKYDPSNMFRHNQNIKP